ncbi:Hypothetical protein R9X50_00412300 [Acrodontium crateriforme]|uniref:Uncharacterized protein n=1 Tax=Acrodontium crateriforme TaxID=150365 RepID=A0AAQ3M4R8_9PEZI|nr:Hypothetical protein R9X50_00412300 [Acrodontium crateriforme]
MQITTQSEWMKAQKHAVVVGPSNHFDVIQTQSETSIFFSLGTDGVLYATKEVQANSIGWTREDLSSGLSSRFNGSSVVAKSFAVSQNSVTGMWDLVVAVTAGGSDHLFISQGNNYAVDITTPPTIAWSNIPFDGDGTTPDTTKIQIADVFVLNSPKAGSTCMVDIWRAPGTNNALDRYYILSGHSPQWNKHLLAIDLDAGSIDCTLGQRSKDTVPGIYTFGSIDGQTELIYAPMRNVFRPTNPPAPARLTVPAGTSAMSSAIDQNGHSALFISSPEGLAVFPSTAQGDGATSTVCITGPLVSGATELQAYTVGLITSVWGRNAQGGLFYATCPAGHEASSSAWSTPVVLVPEVQNFAFYAGLATNSHTVFAHVAGEEMIELDQDPVTSNWRQRTIMLPGTDVNDMVEFNSYTTRIEVIDDNKVAQPNVDMTITAVSPVPVYVDDVYFILNPTTPLSFKTDGNGSVTIIQQTDSIAAVCYNITLTGTSASAVLVDPTSKVMQKLQAIQTGSDLASVNVADSSGTTKPLLPASVSNDNRDAAAQAIKQFSDIGKGLNPDGTPSSGSSVAKAASVSPVRTASSNEHIFSLAIDKAAEPGKALTFYPSDSPAVTDKVANHAMSKLSVGDSVSGGLVKVGDFFKMLGNAIVSGLQTLEVRLVDGLHYVFATIEGTLYHALLDCVSAIVSAVEWVFQQVEIFIEELIAWLGFLLMWKDIVRTHSVMKNAIKQYVKKTFDEIATAEERISNAFDSLEQNLNAWTDVADPGISIGSYTGSKDPDDGSSSPQSHWGVNQARSNMDNASLSQDNSVLGSLETILEDLEALVVNEVDDIKDMVTQIKTQIIDQYSSLTPIQIVKRIIGIVGDLLLKTAKNVIVKVLDIIRAIGDTVLNILDAPIDIPIISPMYKFFADADLSVLDLAVLILSIPATIMYKIAVGSSPFPDNDTTSSLINADSFQALQNLATPDATSHTTMPMAFVRQADVIGDSTPDIPKPVAPTDGVGAVIYRVFAIITRFFGAVTAWVGQIVQDVKFAVHKIAPGSKPAKVWTIVGAANAVIAALPSIVNAFAPNQSEADEWETIMRDTVTGLTILRTLVGETSVGDNETFQKAAPFMDVFLQLAMIPPPIGNIVSAVHDNRAVDSDYVGLAGTFMARFCWIMNPISMAIDDMPELELGLFAAANVCAVLQGILLLASASLFADNK